MGSRAENIPEVERHFIERNEEELEDSLNVLFDALGVPSSDNIVYH